MVGDRKQVAMDDQLAPSKDEWLRHRLARPFHPPDGGARDPILQFGYPGIETTRLRNRAPKTNEKLGSRQGRTTSPDLLVEHTLSYTDPGPLKKRSSFRRFAGYFA